MTTDRVGSAFILDNFPIARATFYRYIDNGKFPKPERKGWDNSWLLSEVEHYFKTTKPPVYVRKGGAK